MSKHTKFHVIPAIDLLHNQCVRLTQGDYTKKIVFEKSPLTLAKQFEDSGFTRLHLVDLEGAKNQKVVHWNILESIAKETNLEIDFSGGMRTLDDLKKSLALGAKYVAIGSLAVKEPKTILPWIHTIGHEKIILACDVKNDRIQTHGWKEESDWSAEDFMTFYCNAGIHHYFSTDITKDGMLDGISTAFYSKMLKSFPTIKLIASGGISQIEDLRKIKQIGCSGAIVGKSLLTGRMDIQELQKEFLHVE